MKRNKANILWIIIISLMIVGLIAFYLYDVIHLHTSYTKHLFRMVAIVCLLVVTLFRVVHGGRRKDLDFYERAYTEELGSAFADRPLLRKKLLCACRLYNECNYRKALKYLFQLLQVSRSKKDSVPVLLFIALCFTDARIHEEAVKAYSELLKIDPDNAQAHSNLGLVLAAMGNFDAALEHYGRSIEIEPENYFAYVNQANLYFRRGDYEQAIADAKQALVFKNNGVEAASLLAIAYALQGDVENKKLYYHIAITSGKKPADLNQAIEYYMNENAL